MKTKHMTVNLLTIQQENREVLSLGVKQTTVISLTTAQMKKAEQCMRVLPVFAS